MSYCNEKPRYFFWWKPADKFSSIKKEFNLVRLKDLGSEFEFQHIVMDLDFLQFYNYLKIAKALNELQCCLSENKNKIIF